MYKVIVVDDEETIVRGLVSCMPWEQYGCEVVATAGSGREALELAREHKPDILFTDINMPEMDGIALIAGLRSEYPDMRITILTGYPVFEYAQKAVEMGVTRYLLKPSKFAQLEEALSAMTQSLSGSPEEQTEPDGAEASQNFIIKNAVKYIEEHYAEKITLQDVAQSVYVSQWHLSKLISKNTDGSFTDLINSIRIRKAKELLADPALRIWEISEMVGFGDVSHFSRIFKKYENMSANEYRNRFTGVAE